MYWFSRATQWVDVPNVPRAGLMSSLLAMLASYASVALPAAIRFLASTFLGDRRGPHGTQATIDQIILDRTHRTRAAMPAALLCAQLQCVAGADDPRVPRVCVRRVGGGPDQGADQGMARRPRPRGAVEDVLRF